jgi:hypothetical protein
VTSSVLASLPAALVRPDSAFSRKEIYGFPRILIALLLFLLYVVGLRLAAGFDQNPYYKELAAAEVDAQLGSLMASAPPEAQKQARDQAMSQILGNQGSVMSAISIVISALFFLLFVVEMQLICAVVTQFFGGQEERHGRERPSMTLFLTAALPLALRKLLQGLLLSFRNPEIAANALSVKEYRALSAVRFDLYSFLPPLGLPAFFDYVLRLATDPFMLWTAAVLVLGGREIFRVSLKGAAGQAAVLFLVLCLQFALLSRIGINMEL